MPGATLQIGHRGSRADWDAYQLGGPLPPLRIVVSEQAPDLENVSSDDADAGELEDEPEAIGTPEVEVEIPAGALPGQYLAIKQGDRIVQVEIPEDASPGSHLIVPLENPGRKHGPRGRRSRTKSLSLAPEAPERTEDEVQVVVTDATRVNEVQQIKTSATDIDEIQTIQTTAIR